MEIEKRNEQSMTEQRGDILSDDDEIIEIIPRQFPTPDEEMLTPVEAMYIQYFHKDDRRLPTYLLTTHKISLCSLVSVQICHQERYDMLSCSFHLKI